MLRLSDGTRSADEIAARVFGDADRVHRDATGQALLDLMEAGLIAENAEARGRLFSRRAVGKAAAALLLGGVGLPLVKSITAPDAASALTRCGDGGPADPCGPDIGGCQSCCCCFVSPGIVLCADRAACEPTYECI